jgi:hypothetical protein
MFYNIINGSVINCYKSKFITHFLSSSLYIKNICYKCINTYPIYHLSFTPPYIQPIYNFITRHVLMVKKCYKSCFYNKMEFITKSMR